MGEDICESLVIKVESKGTSQQVFCYKAVDETSGMI